MKTKKGISLVVLIITIIVMIILTGIVIVQIDNSLAEVEMADFIVELTTIEDKIKEYYILTGSLPIKDGKSYNLSELQQLVVDANNRTLLQEEIAKNEDNENIFYAIDLELMQIETNERGKSGDLTDEFVMASNTLNVYYIGGVVVDDITRFSLVDLVEKNEIDGNDVIVDATIELDETLDVTKDTKVWTNEINITIKNDLESDETLTYSIGDAESKAVPANNRIKINSQTLTDGEKTALNSNKQVTVNRVKNGEVIETKSISLENLDIKSPVINKIAMATSDLEEENEVMVEYTDDGGSGVQGVYYDYVSIIENGVTKPYYSHRSFTTTQDLIDFGRASNNGVITLDKNIKSIAVVVKDNAGNLSEVVTYIISEEE